MINVKGAIALCTIFVAAVFVQPANAWVQKISLERVFVGENVRVHEVAVRCRIEKKSRTMRRVVSSSGQWCSIDAPQLCAKSKVTAARRLCKFNAQEFSALANTGVKPVTPLSISTEPAQITEKESKKELLEEQMLIEEQRIEIAQRRIELSRREVSLKKRLNEMQVSLVSGT